MNDNAILQAAHALANAGLCVLPAAPDGTKRPAVPWKEWQHTRPTPEQLDTWFAGGGHQGLGVVCGAVSGGLEMLELEGRAVADNLLAQMTELAHASGLGDLWRRVAGGYMEVTPTGGIHLLYRVTGPVAGNTKLARRPGPPDPATGRPTIELLAETRGEGGWVVVAPSAGTTHPSGKPWTLAAGGPGSIATLTEAERDALHHLAGAFDAMPIGPQDLHAQPDGTRLFTQPAPGYEDGGVPPGDDYNERTTWDEILIPLGWTRVWQRGNEVFWCRPGKSTGISATTGRNDADNLFVFSTSTDFEPERPYDKFGAYAHIHHGGNHSQAARALLAAGYGRRPEPTRPATGPQAPPLVDGNLATVHELQPGTAHLTLVEERTYANSDDGNALALVDRFGDVVRFCADRGRWLAWDGTRWEWQPVSGGIVREYAKRVARALPEGDKQSTTHKKYALSASGVTAMLTQASTDTRTVVAFGDLDAHPFELNTPAGIIDLTSGQLLPSDASRLHTRITSCAPDPSADTTLWTQFLNDTFGADDELISYLRRLVGYSATGAVTRHVLPFCVGSGGNGKGVFLEALMAVLGDYATTAPSGFLMAKAHPQHETEIARLAGVRMVVCSEVGDDDRFDEVKVKLLTGGDSLTARFMRQDHFTFTATHTLWLMGNHKPHVRAGGRAFWRRLRLIPFEHEVPEDKMIDDLQGILARDHGPALLAWIVAGAAEYAAGGLAEPERVKAATAEYAADQDTVSRFVEERCHLAPLTPDHVQTQTTKLRQAYEAWCYSEGEAPVSAKKLTQELARKFGVGQDRTSKARSYTGIALLADDEDPSSGPEADNGKIGGPGW
ncbi:phage/plasmid primase, P4 family [Microbispora sp. KK1-11]|uniref:phage/plasmid primase, P4 family n=1 Tax=Microbispora sp. KK1-11 TaxID=2053005 RepID=UPI0021B021BA|nr:phage/plasmid primase, P4 family [Microbispora sp. KK1-11]